MARSVGEETHGTYDDNLDRNERNNDEFHTVSGRLQT